MYLNSNTFLYSGLVEVNKQFLAAKSRWTNFILARYVQPLATSCVISTRSHKVNCFVFVFRYCSNCPPCMSSETSIFDSKQIPRNSTTFSCFSWDQDIASFKNSMLFSLLFIFLMATFLISKDSSEWLFVRIPSNTSPNAPAPNKSKQIQIT